MGFTSVSNRISNFPLVLVGPILRKVTKRSVSVFIVTKQSSSVTLEVFNSNQPASSILSSTATTMSLGEHVHVSVITASSSSDVLTTNTVYAYNLSFSGTPMVKANGDLEDGILINSTYTLPEGIAYGNHILPTFVLPAADVNKLRFSHGSCRKPHGGKTDALRGLDTILASSVGTVNSGASVNTRPQFLCLTGDQIYADDVADALLHMLIDQEEHLYNWGTPDAREDLPENPSNAQLTPGSRFPLVGQNPDATSPRKFSQSDGHAKSHLIRLAEYYNMYMMAWSDVLWPASNNDFPTFQQVYGEEPFETRVVPDIVFNSGNTMGERTIQVSHIRRGSFTKELAAITEFKRSLKYVRRALANIPTYMMFDDHEITDDWFLTRLWVQNAMQSGSLTKRVLQNGLAAFAVFQAWGNTPERFTSGSGALILGQLESLNTNGGGNTSVFDAIGNLVLPTLNSGNTQLQNSFPWHFHLDFDVFRLIVLDTRTQRGYSASESFPALINSSQINNQVPTNTSLELAIVVSPAPVFGNIAIEGLQRLVRNPIIAFFQGGPGNNYFMDQEAWVFNKAALENLLHRLSDFPSTVLLSGDVHYAFSATIAYWDNRSSTIRRSAFGQLCSSSLKNSDDGTESASSSTFARPRLDPQTYEFLGWDTPGNHIIAHGLDVIEGTSFPTGRDMPRHVSGTPAVHLIDGNYRGINTGSAHTPKWRYRITFQTDSRTPDQRLSTTPSALASTNHQANSGYRHYNRFQWDGHRYTIGRDNICLVKLTDNGTKAIQEFWYVLGPLVTTSNGSTQPNATQFVPQPATVHEIDIAPPTSTVTMPGN